LTLLQLHNSITPKREDLPTSITPSDVLRRGGVLDAMKKLRDEGLLLHIGFTGIGYPASLAEVIRTGSFEAVQTPFHLLNPSAGYHMPFALDDWNYGKIIPTCARKGMGVLAIRVLAGGALAQNQPSNHTRRTPFFPIKLYESDREQSRRLQAALGPARPLAAEAVRFALAHPKIHSALMGFATEAEIDDAIAAMEDDVPPLGWQEVLDALFPPDR
jgi:aryl-alcohol dehydrogenase-like predicted oxidoreductase